MVAFLNALAPLAPHMASLELVGAFLSPTTAAAMVALGSQTRTLCLQFNSVQVLWSVFELLMPVLPRLAAMGTSRPGESYTGDLALNLTTLAAACQLSERRVVMEADKGLVSEQAECVSNKWLRTVRV